MFLRLPFHKLVVKMIWRNILYSIQWSCMKIKEIIIDYLLYFLILLAYLCFQYLCLAVKNTNKTIILCHIIIIHMISVYLFYCPCMDYTSRAKRHANMYRIEDNNNLHSTTKYLHSSQIYIYFRLFSENCIFVCRNPKMN